MALSIAAFREMEEEAAVAEEEARGDDDEEEESVRPRHAGPVTQKSLAVLGREGGVKMDVSVLLI